MVKLMLDGMGGDCRHRPPGSPHPLGIECYHVNARFSRGLEEVGAFKSGKLFLIFWFWLQVLWCRYRYGVENFYYVPAPGKRVAVYRDWLVMLLCRIFFKRLILHWHAAGLSQWLEMETSGLARALNYRLFRPVDLSIVISAFNRADGEKLASHQIRVVPNGIPDPCPDFETAVLPRRLARLAVRTQWLGGQTPSASELASAGEQPQVVKVLYLAHCMREKGLFDTLEAVALANQQLVREQSPLRLHLTVAGEFVRPEEKAEFEFRLTRPDIQCDYAGETKCCVTYVGFVGGERKRQVFVESDLFCFPTYYSAESFGLVAVEAMAFGLPVVATRWRSLKTMFPADYPGLVPPQAPQEVAAALLRLLPVESGERLRTHFLAHYTVEKFLSHLAAALHEAEATR